MLEVLQTIVAAQSQVMDSRVSHFTAQERKLVLDLLVDGIAPLDKRCYVTDLLDSLDQLTDLVNRRLNA